VTTAGKLSELAQTESLKNEWRARSQINAERFEWYRREEFWTNLKTFLPHVKQITLAGGEPFLIKEQFAFVKACCEIGEAAHIELRYHTNASVFDEELPPYWKRFQRVLLIVSLDGIEDVANYVRYPTDWGQIQDNIERFDRLGDNIATLFQFTAHALNIYRLPEVLDWADGSGFRNRTDYRDLQEYVRTYLVHYPPNQSIRVLPLTYKKSSRQNLAPTSKGHWPDSERTD
jgi:glutamate-1-semialdehyde 2,1-aminomutase